MLQLTLVFLFYFFYLFALSEHVASFIATLYELRSSIAADKKRELLIEVAKWSGDGLRTTCLKMPTVEIGVDSS